MMPESDLHISPESVSSAMEESNYITFSVQDAAWIPFLWSLQHVY